MPPPTRSRRPGATRPTSSSPAPGPASSGCSTRPPTCCSTPSSARRTTRRFAPERAVDEPVEPTPQTPPPRRPRRPRRPPPADEPAPEAARTGRDGFLVRALGGLGALALGILAVLTLAVAGDRGRPRAPGARRTPACADARTRPRLLPSGRRRRCSPTTTGHLPADREARRCATSPDSFEKEYLKNFALLEKQKDGTPGLAVQTKTVVTATVLGSGVMDAEDGRRAGAGLRQPGLQEGRAPTPRSSRTGSR